MRTLEQRHCEPNLERDRQVSGTRQAVHPSVFQTLQIGGKDEMRNITIFYLTIIDVFILAYDIVTIVNLYRGV